MGACRDKITAEAEERGGKTKAEKASKQKETDSLIPCTSDILCKDITHMLPSTWGIHTGIPKYTAKGMNTVRTKRIEPAWWIRPPCHFEVPGYPRPPHILGRGGRAGGATGDLYTPLKQLSPTHITSDMDCRPFSASECQPHRSCLWWTMLSIGLCRGPTPCRPPFP